MNILSPSVLAACALALAVSCDSGAPRESRPNVAQSAESTKKTESPASPAGATPAASSAPSPVDPEAARAADAAVEAFEAAKVTPAPLRATATARLDAAPADVWAYVSDHGNLSEYAGAIGVQKVVIDASKAETEHGVGTRRECTAMGDQNIVEEITYFAAPHVFAYSAVDNPLGLKDHLGVVIVRPAPGGKTELQWRQYFDIDDEGSIAMTTMKVKMMSSGLMGFFTKKYGGELLPS